MIGLCLKQGNKYKYSRPLLMDFTDTKYFNGQFLRDIDYSLMVRLDDELELFIINYTSKFDYYQGNIKNKNPNEFNILNKYILRIENIDNEQGYLYIKLNENNELTIKFSMILCEKNEYYMSNPYLSGLKEFLKDHIDI
jgi:hypothetical protein